MSDRSTQGERAMVDELVDHLSVGGDGDLVGTFARAYLRRAPADFLATHTLDEWSAHLRAILEFANSRRGDDVAVRVFNPERDTHGYELPGSVVEVAAPDMAFLVDSVTNEIEAHGHSVARLLHPVIGTERAGDGSITSVLRARNAKLRESIQHYELDRRLDATESAELTESVEQVLIDVRRAVGDFEPMRSAIARMISVAKDGAARYDQDEIEDAIAFLEWLLDLNFVFLGYREYQIRVEDGERKLSVIPGSGLGILGADDQSAYAAPVALSELRPSLRERYEDGDLLVITKTNSTSRVHRRAKADYIGVRHIGEDGSVIGEARLLGLFTTKAYMAPADSLPVLQRKLQRIIEAEDLYEGSHVYKAVVQLFNSFPTDELFASPTDALRKSIIALVGLQEHQQIRLFVRRDLLQRNVSVLVVVPRDRFNARLRRRIQDLLLERFDGRSVDYRLAMGETDTARLHFTVWIAGGQVPNVSIETLEAEVIAAAQTWEERLSEALIEHHGPDIGAALVLEWAGHFPPYYQSSTAMDVAVADVGMLDELVRSAPGQSVVGLHNETSGEAPLTRLAVYRADGKLELSAIMPTLEALGLRVVEEVPTRLSGNRELFIHDFGVLDGDGEMLDVNAVGRRVADTVGAVLAGQAESDSLNRLIVSSGLDHKQVRILRAYRTYWRRVNLGFTVEYVNDAFAAHPGIAADLVHLFATRFDPDQVGADETTLQARIHVELDNVVSLDEDRILRGFLGLITATRRTNAYRNGFERLVFKFHSADVPAMPQPAPLYEVFVYSNDVEGIHLRGGSVARGGIRWSTRKEDYRTEVLGLMKAQMTKNAVIVPTGSKGGFVLRHPPEHASELADAVRQGYITFIRGLLDVTDNLIDGEVRHPDHVRVLDGPDPYLVVAADKGTATYSDTANEIAAEYEFWLKDAFASGGSAGYDHKALGITARGAWESVKWHFREIGVDMENDPFTVVGIGDMSGDVFGNGMLLSPMIKLVAAFDHRHVFIDPDPDPATSFAERQRLFGMAQSSWKDYDESLISPGGGVYSRAAKRIELSDEARRILDVGARELTPDEVIRAILCSRADLLWNGGIGTYVKASSETDEQVGDRINDGLRVNGDELRCKVVGEGGNLGLTQLGRIEFWRGGGRIYTDFIDNSGGVHCSDREVNLKVLLGLAEDRGELSKADRDVLITEVAEDVVVAILYENFLQAQILAQDIEHSAHNMEAYEELISVLEEDGMLDRDIEGLASPDDMKERARTGVGMPAPEVAVLLAYAKRSLRQWLLDSDLPDWDDFSHTIDEYFPAKVVAQFGHLIVDHPLRRELIATVVANRVVNSEGVTFVTRLMAESGAAAEEVVRAYHIARDLTGATQRWQAVEALVGRVPTELVRHLIVGIDALVESLSRWYLAHPSTEFMSTVIERAKPDFEELARTIADIGPARWRTEQDVLVAGLVDQGVPEPIAHQHIYQDELVHAPDMIEVARQFDRPVRDVADVFLMAGAAFEIDWLEAQVAALPTASHWQRRAIQTIEEDLVLLRRQLAVSIFEEAESSDPHLAFEHYLVARTHELGRLTRFMRTVAGDGVTDIAGVIVAIRQIRSLAS